MMTTILTDTVTISVPTHDGPWLTADQAQAATGWTLKPEGMCRDEICVPLPPSLRRDDRVDIAGFWQLLGHPVVHDDAGEAWVLGTGAEARNAALTGLQAPDFTLPDLAGVPHRLADLRGRKVFLSTWASW